MVFFFSTRFITSNLYRTRWKWSDFDLSVMIFTINFLVIFWCILSFHFFVFPLIVLVLYVNSDWIHFTGDEVPPSTFSMTNIEEWDQFRNIDMDKEVLTSCFYRLHLCKFLLFRKAFWWTYNWTNMWNDVCTPEDHYSLDQGESITLRLIVNFWFGMYLHLVWWLLESIS